MLQSITTGLYAYVGAIGTNNSIAAFDLDWTLVRPIKGRFPKNEDDWEFLPGRLYILKKYIDFGYTLAIFTNQGYRGEKLTMAIGRLNKILTFLVNEKINIWMLAATGANSSYRKPNIEMWQVLTRYIPQLDKNNSMYVGDAAGRPQDYDNNDILFAKNIGIPFYTPEEIFPQNSIIIPDTQTMFIFVGAPGSGKSTFFQQNLKHRGWVFINQDILKTQSKMLREIKNALILGKSVAVDATNPQPNKRMEYITLAAQYQIPTLIIYFVRNGYEWNKLRPNPVPNIVYNIYYKNLVEPTQELDLVPVVQLF